MIVKVIYDSEVLGRDEFWRGTIDQIGNLRNVVAKQVARKVFTRETKTATIGMWTATLVEDAHQ